MHLYVDGEIDRREYLRVRESNDEHSLYSITHVSTANSSLAVNPALVRLSMAIEHVDDLRRTLDQSLFKRISRQSPTNS